MIGSNIKAARKAKGFSQEELAVRLNVVRQTVSKWEHDLSAPDADILIQLAELLEVPVGQLLGVESQADAEQGLTEQLARLNEELAGRVHRERLAQQINKKRGAVLLLTFLSLPAALASPNESVSLILFGGCILAAAVIFYRNLTLLTGSASTRGQLWAVRAATCFDIAFAVVLLVMTGLYQSGLATLSEEDTQTFVTACIAAFMLFAGFISPKLPFNRYTGFRLPWTIRDEDAWNVAHRLLGYLSLPFALLYLAACWKVGGSAHDWGIVTMLVLLFWIGIPGTLSFLFFWKKVYGKL